MNKDEARVWRGGARAVLRRYGIWRDGQQWINDRPVPDLLREIDRLKLDGWRVSTLESVYGQGADLPALEDEEEKDA